MKRLFIAINLPEEVKNQIEQIIRQINIDLHWIPKENWHLTISFLGYQPDEAISGILKSLQETAKNYSNILKNIRMIFEKIILAPPEKTPRMIWFCGSKETSRILGEIKTKLEDELIKNGVRFQRENREYNAHLTLARFKPSPQNFQLLNYQLPITFYVQSLDLMESHLHPHTKRGLLPSAQKNNYPRYGVGVKRTGAEYEILANVDFIKKI